ncbi:tetratricopeptide repeat protein [Pontiellaceae bacterium B12219]|nr:tetratricopeptide repeat protein [Pontiellaceae bacterium B12219]
MKKKKAILISASIMATLIMFVGCGEKSGEKEYNKAIDALNSGDLVRARTLLEKSIRKISGSAKKSTALNQLGIVLWDLGEAQAAAEAFSQSANLSEQISGANLNLGLALFQAGRSDEAEFALNNVLGEDPDNETAIAVLGLIELRKRNWTGATRELSKAANINPGNPAAQNALALAELHQSKNSQQSIKRLEQILAAFPEYAPAAYNLGAIYDQWLKNSSAAMDWYNQYLQLAGENGSHSLQAKQAITRLGGTAPTTGGGSSGSAIRKSDPLAAARYMKAGASMHAAQKYKEAVEEYRKALMEDPTLKTAYYNMGLAFYAEGNYTDAANACNSALNIDPSFSDARYMLSLSYAKLKKWNDADREASELSKTDPTRGNQMKKYISDSRKL